MTDKKFLGLLFGQAIGDALGLASEFMTKEEVKHYYPNGINSYADIIQDRHRSIWQKGMWTDDTDQMLCIVESLIQCKEVNLTDIAQRFVAWKKTNGRGIGRHTLNVLSMGDYVAEPFVASEFVWQMSRKQSAANGAIMRTSIVACCDYNDWEKIKENTENVCKLTHYDPRCVGSCVVITYVVYCCLTNQRINKSDILRIADEYDERIGEYIELAFQENISLLYLDEQGKIGYTLKAMSAALWAFNHASCFHSGLKTIIEQGGDADSNGAVAGAVLGLKFGVDSILPIWIDELIDKAKLLDIATSFIKTTSS